MPVAVSLPQISTNVRLAATRLLFPDLAAAWAERLFLTPPARNAASATELLDARERILSHRGRLIATWSWGPVDAPAVLLVHGWGGHAAQLRSFVSPLLHAGFSVVTYDQPAHGVSEGRLTGLPDFADLVAEVAHHYGGVRGVLGHSLGATAAAFALARRTIRIEKMVLISPPSDLVGYSRRFARWHWMPERLRRAMQIAIEERYGLRWDELELARLAPRVEAHALVIHNRGDSEMRWPGAKFMTTVGLGHGRILRDDAVIDAATAFLCAR